MAIEFKLPDLGENVESGDVLNVLVHEGDTIQANQNVIELETDKATVEIPCPHAGRVSKIHVQPGQTVPIGTLLLSIEGAASDGAAAPAKDGGAKAASPAKEAPAAKAAPAEEPEEDEDEPAPAPKAAAPKPAATKAAPAKPAAA